MAPSSKRAYATCWSVPGLLQPERLSLQPSTADPCLRSCPLLTCASAGDTQTLKGGSGSVYVDPLGPGVHKVLFEPSVCLWWVWGLSLNAISPLLPSCWGFSFALGCGVSFFGGIQHSPVDGCSISSRNFEVLSEENEHILLFLHSKLWELMMDREAWNAADYLYGVANSQMQVSD